MFPARAVLAALSVVALTVTQAHAEEKEKEADAIIELGRSGNWLSGPFSFGPTAAVEFTPVENWLEIEVGTGPRFGKGISEWETDILFKKPFTHSNKVEFCSVAVRNGVPHFAAQRALALRLPAI